MRAVLMWASLLLPAVATALEPLTTHTKRLSEGETAAVGTVEDAAWLVGSWRGMAFGKTFEAHWSAPSAGTMVGTFKLMTGDVVDFYEILVLDTVDGNLTLRVRHFSLDFSAWEDKTDHVRFRFLGKEENALHFSGISFYRLGPDRMDGYLVMRIKDGVREEKLVYTRRPD